MAQDFGVSARVPEKQWSVASQTPGDAIINIDIDSRATTTVNTHSLYSSKSPEDSTKPTAAEIAAANLEINHTITIPLHDYPNGIPLQAAFQSSDQSFSIYRSFDYLHSRVILELQDELRCLEDGLADLDRIDNNPRRIKCITSRAGDIKQAKRDNKPSERASLLSRIRETLVNYDEMLSRARDLNAFQRPSHRDYRSLRRWFWNEKPLCSSREEAFIKRKEDLVTLRHGREWAGFDGLVEEIVSKMPTCWLKRYIFTTPALRAKTSDTHIFYCSASRIEALVNLLITLIIFVLLVLPVVAMYKLTAIGDRNNTFDAIGILVVFTLLFSVAMGVLTRAKRHELFAAGAGYAAVLVVFISNFQK
ncbi:hypothetical protein BDV95DRAFT_146952 [Massariosphaeria phaeospora]|uniref:DUF6594 domain-containing protein n=1 Tax=Massariosphaeria phaeospora TaxID=100035 RepID=A0A7C8IEK9_9PLEO|nr:hypothetical protein BDV95DRAFT_146952 [Massariosphaeria phaeospora]